MNNRNNRATRAIIASGSLLAIIFIAGPWVDEYLRLRREAVQLRDLEVQLAETHEQEEQLDRVDAKLTQHLEDLQAGSIGPAKTEPVRERIVEIVRQAGGRIRRLEISEGQRRAWAIEGDDVRNGNMPLYGEESTLELHSHIVELQADGSLESVRQVLSNVVNQGWLMQTNGLTMTPTNLRESPVNLELQLTLYGLAPRKHDTDEETENYAQASGASAIR